MNVNKTLSSAALLLATTALLAVSSFAATQVAVNAPTFTTNNHLASGTVAAGVYPAGVHAANPALVVTVSASGSPSGQVICYTTDSTTPACTNSGGVVTPAGTTLVYSTPISMTPQADSPAGSGNGAGNVYTVKAISVPPSTLSTYKASAVQTWKFTVENQLPAPVASVGSSTTAVQVTFSENFTIPGAASVAAGQPALHYTLDGITVPTSTVGTKLAYSTVPAQSAAPWLSVPLELGTTPQTLQIVASATGFINSSVVTGQYGAGVTSGIQYFIGSGSSAQFDEFALAAAGPLGDGTNGAQVGKFHYTASNAGNAYDTRSGVTPTEKGNIWLVWDHCNDLVTPGNVNGGYIAGCDGLPVSKIAVYVSLDSTLGVKAFMNSNLKVPSAYFGFVNSQASPVAAANSLAPFWPTTGANADQASVPPSVYNSLNGQPFNAGVTDIRPEDAKFATTRALAKITATRTGLGYGSGTSIGSAVSQGAINGLSATSFNVVDFAITGKDPINGALQQSFTTIPVGAAPVIVFVNTKAPTTDNLFHFGDPTVTNVSRATLTGLFNGSITRTSALSPLSGVTGAPVHVYLREPLSGTYNTFEYTTPASKEFASSQEIGIDPTIIAADGNGNTGNPLHISVAQGKTSSLGTTDANGNMIGLTGATRDRAIGTGNMIKAVSYPSACTGTEASGAGVTCTGGADSIGYAFWSFVNFKNGNGHAPFTTKYLQVDGVDPLFPGYTSAESGTNGQFPVCDSTNFIAGSGSILPSCPTNPTFTNIVNGSYPIWSLYRVVTTSTVPPLVSALITQAQTSNAVGIVQDFIPYASLNVFRSHYLQAGVKPSNGHIAGSTEAGGDMGGAIYYIQADFDHIADYGTELVSVKQ